VSRRFAGMYATVGRPSIPPEKLLRARLLQMLYTIRSERLLMEEMDYNLLFRWFVGLNADDEGGIRLRLPRIASLQQCPVYREMLIRGRCKKRC
jgi:transposase